MPLLLARLSFSDAMSTSSSKPPTNLSSGYTLAIFLSIPAGLIIGFRWFSHWPTPGFIAISCAPAVLICLAAYLDTRRRRN